MTPAEKCAQLVRDAVEGIRAILLRASTESVAGACFSFNVLRGQPGQPLDSSLLAPARQCSFLLGVLLSLPEPASPKEFSEKDWDEVRALLNEAFSAYQILFWPDASSSERPSQEWIRVRDVALPALFDSFGSRIMASAEQLANRIRRYVSPFDDEVRRANGISATEGLAIAEWIVADLQSTFDRLPEVLREEKKARRDLLAEAATKGWSLEEIRAEANRPDRKAKFDAYISGVRRLGVVTLTELKAKFPETATSFWNTFSIRRGEGREICFPTERSTFDERPLIRLSDTEAIAPMANVLVASVLEVSERILSDGPLRAKFFRARDQALEEESAVHLAALLGAGASVYRGVCEKPTGELEHDTVAFSDHVFLIAESKASPPTEPFRDPDKAFERLRRDFKAETGIQAAYRQALRLWKRLAAGEDVPLYDHSGNEVVRIPASASTSAFCVCITRESHGVLATDLELLLEREPGDPYPWVISVLDLETLANGWRFLGLTEEQLGEYLRIRVELHGKIFSSDELDYVGSFLKHGARGLQPKSEGDVIFLNPEYSGIFDDIYHHLQYGTPAPDLTKRPPALMDVRRSLAAGRPISAIPGEKPNQHIGRNEPCPCLSGKKFKKCCGRSR